MGGCPHHSTECHVHLLDVVSSGSISPVFHLLLSPLSPGSRLNSWHLGLSSASPDSTTPTATYFYSFSWPSRCLSCLFPYLILSFFLSSPHFHPPSQIPLPLPAMVILLPLLSRFEAPTLWSTFLLNFT